MKVCEISVTRTITKLGGYIYDESFCKRKCLQIDLGTHLGTFSDEDSEQYMEAIAFAVKNGIASIDTAINYRGMRSEKDIGKVISSLISSGKIKREDDSITKGLILPS